MEQKRRSMRKDEKGFTGLEAAIVLTAFIVVAAVFSYVVLNAGFFTTEKAKEVVHTGVETATSSVILAGDIIAVEGTTSDTVSTLRVPLKLSAGRGAIQIGESSVASNLTVSYADRLKYDADCAWTRDFTEERTINNILDYGEKVELAITVPEGSLLKTAGSATDATFQLEIKPVEGASLAMSKRTTASIEPVNVLY